MRAGLSSSRKPDSGQENHCGNPDQADIENRETVMLVMGRTHGVRPLRPARKIFLCSGQCHSERRCRRTGCFVVCTERRHGRIEERVFVSRPATVDIGPEHFDRWIVRGRRVDGFDRACRRKSRTVGHRSLSSQAARMSAPDGGLPRLCLSELPRRDTVPAGAPSSAMLDSPRRAMLRAGVTILP